MQGRTTGLISNNGATMRHKGLTLGQGILRAYLVLWLLWALILAFSSHKALLTSVGVTYWTEESVSERSKVKHEAEYKALDCDNPIRRGTEQCTFLSVMMNSFPLNDIVTNEDTLFATRAFLLGAVTVPIAVLLVGFLLWILTKWVIRGFVSNDEK